MNIFPKANLAHDWKCPICQGNEDKPVALCKIDGTEDGNLIEGIQVHMDCIDLRYSNKPDFNEILYMVWDDNE